MRLITYQLADGSLRLGSLREDVASRVVDLAAGAAALGLGADGSLSSMLALIEAGARGLDLAREVAAAAPGRSAEPWASLDAAAVKWKSPLPVPPQFRDCLMFEEHLLNSFAMLRQTLAAREPDPEAALAEFEAKGVYRVPPVWYDIPVYYKANRFSFIGHDEDVIWPSYTEKLDFELEYACVLGSYVKDVSVAQAKQHIFGYTIFNDISARDVQSVEMQASLGPSKGKDFDTGNIMGPCIVTADAVDADDMTMIARINGEEWCRGNSGSAHWSFADVIAHASRSETLVPGECIGSGTVGGGCGLEHDRYLNPGDVIELEVEGIGILRNRVTRPGA
jgi:2-keto-4-pentenoate hydratase/2-oxohepta-3-ene-1,7-dioic acid hydratase in catechol pathway